MDISNVLYLPSGRIFLIKTDDGYTIESTEMRDVNTRCSIEVRNTLDPHIIWKNLVPYEKKWLLTVSTQKGCSHDCKFCDVASMPFKGNLSQEEIESQIKTILECTPYVQKCDKVKIGFARMGEPSWNLKNVFGAMNNLDNISASMGRQYKWLPCFNSIIPRKAECIDEVMEMKEKRFNGFFHFQISCNSTDENSRKEMFGEADVLSIDEVVKKINKWNITSRTVTLNFIVMDGIEVDVNKLKKMGITGDQFTVKLIPLNNTINSQLHKLKTYANYSSYEKLETLKNEFEKEGIPTVMDAIAKCEEASLCCGQLAQIFL
jgi:23S rRNA (adenine2503-C2)-methyltransferase